MNAGMMWFDNDPKTTLVEKVQKAAHYYRDKYGSIPDLCLVHPSMLADSPVDVGALHIRSLRAVLPGHLWIGRDEPLPGAAD